MADGSVPIRRFYDGWATYNECIVEVVRELSDVQLQIRLTPSLWPIWATIGHTAGARVYWLCGVLGEPGVETTPFRDPLSGVGWEDDLDTPRRADELVRALDTTWAIVDGCLDRWTSAMLEDTFVRRSERGMEVHTRQSVLMRLISHDAYHSGELSQTLGIHGLPQIDLWKPIYVSASGEAQ
jgi:uncharacterized damage-inducible protein DinB